MEALAKKRAISKRRVHRVRAHITGTTERPRLSVHFSNMHISAQIIDDSKSATLVYVTTIGRKLPGTTTEKATQIGQEIAVKAKKAKISKVVMDRGARRYHGRIKALAEAARKEGLGF